MSNIQKYKRLLFVLGVAIVIIFVVPVVAFQTGFVERTKIGSQTCDAITPECGGCTEFEIGGYCYTEGR
jgi:hypothetical protein